MDLTTFNVKRSLTQGGPYTTIATGLGSASYVNTGLSNGTQYFYVISAVNEFGESSNSNEASAIPFAGSMSVTSTNFVDAGAMPLVTHSTQAVPAGGNNSPQLTWDSVANAASYALEIVDMSIDGGNNGGHWLVSNIPAGTVSLAQNASISMPIGAIQHSVDFTNGAYNGPFPPLNSTHIYRIRVYALSTTSNVPISTTLANFRTLINSSILAFGDISGTVTAVDTPNVTGITVINTDTNATILDTSNENVSTSNVAVPIIMNYLLTNTGNNNLALGSLTFNNANNCTASNLNYSASVLAPTNSTPFNFTLTPAAGGVWSIDPHIANNRGGTFNWYITGNANAAAIPEISVERSSNVILNNDIVAGTTIGIPTSLIYNIRNLGTAVLNLTGVPVVNVTNPVGCTTLVTQPGTTVQPAATVNATIQVTPSANSWSFNVSVANNDSNENPYVWVASGTAFAPEMAVSLTSPGTGNILDGGSHSAPGSQVGAPLAINYVINNTGTSALNLTGLPIVQLTPGGILTQSDVSVTTIPSSSIPSLSTANMQITVTPTTAGAWTLGVSIANNDSNENPYNWVISDTAAPAAPPPAPEMNIKRGINNIADDGTPDSVTGTTATVLTTLTYTIENTGNANLTVGTVTVTSGVNCTTTLSSSPGSSVPSGTSTSFNVDITPTAAGVWDFGISIVNNDSNENPYGFNVTGTAVALAAPEMNVSR